MKAFPFITGKLAIKIFRISVALLLVAHGVARTSLGTVADFGGFLESKGFPAGVAIAWILTIVEIAGGLALAAGFLVKWLCLWFIVELLMGIILVHSQNGWFVVGASLNGVEYSVLLIFSLWLIATLHSQPKISSAT